MSRKKQSKNRFISGVVTAILAIALVISLVFNVSKQQPQDVQSQQSMMEFEEVITGIVDNTQGSVVSVANYQVDQSGNLVWGPRGLEVQDIEQEPVLAGTGSGVIYRLDGDYAYVVTNNHVIDGYETLEVTLADGTTVQAEEVGSDLLSDLAVLRIQGVEVENPIEFADSDQVQVGQLAIAIGSPIGLNFSSSVTQGIVSGLDRTIPVDHNSDGRPDWEMVLMQTDAAINPGNSGGALVNSQGQLIGINSSKFAASAIEGMGFAIPSNDVQDIITQLEENGEVIRPVLGISNYSLYEFTQETRINDFNLPEDLTEGTVVVRVQDGSAAEVAGLQVFDVITEINGEAVTDAQSLKQLLYQYQIGDTIELGFYRNGEFNTVSVELTEAQETSMR